MSSNTIARAIELAETIRETARRRPFEKALQDFIHLLAEVPYLAARDLSAAEVGVLRAIAESVIDRVEQRIAGDDDATSVQLKLAGSIYEIRRRLENIDQWSRHFFVKQ